MDVFCYLLLVSHTNSENYLVINFSNVILSDVHLSEANSMLAVRSTVHCGLRGWVS